VLLARPDGGEGGEDVPQRLFGLAAHVVADDRPARIDGVLAADLDPGAGPGDRDDLAERGAGEERVGIVMLDSHA
jgi:hypothetical protein